MPRPALRSRSLRRVFVRTPGGRTVIHYERKKNGEAHCAICGRRLNAVPTNEIYKFSKTEKRPERPFGGTICHTCLEQLIKKAARS
jgi:large subunit ribosomal protein L34e